VLKGGMRRCLICDLVFTNDRLPDPHVRCGPASLRAAEFDATAGD